MKYLEKIKNLKTFEEINKVDESIKEEAKKLWKKEFNALTKIKKDWGFPSVDNYIKTTIGVINLDLDGNVSKNNSAKKVVKWFENQGLYAEYIIRN